MIITAKHVCQMCARDPQTATELLLVPLACAAAPDTTAKTTTETA